MRARLPLLLIALIAPVAATFAETEAPEQVVKQYLSAVARRPAAAAQFYDEASLARYKALIVRSLGDSPGDPNRLGGLSGEEARSLDPGSLYERAFQPFPGTARGDAVVLGSVPEGDAISHVVVRSAAPDVGVDSESVVEVITAMRVDGRWFVKMQELPMLESLLDIGQGFDEFLRDIEKNTSEE